MLCRKRYRPSVQWLLVFVVSPLLLTSACAPAKETSKEPGKPTAAWPSDADGALLACVSKDRTGAFQFDRYMTVQQAEPRHHKPDLKYYPELKGEYVRQYAFRCLDDEGNVLYELPFTHDYTAAVKTGGQSGCIIYMLETHASFVEWLPLSSRTRVLQFVEGGKVVAEKRRSPHPPEVRLGSARIQADGKVSVPWSVEDKDDRELSMKLAFHDPDGQHLLAEALKLVLAPRPHVNGHSEDAYTQGYGSPEVGPDFMEFDATVFQGGKGCRLEVAVSDGINWTTAVSEPFDTSSRVPGIRIVKPKQGAIFTQDETVDLWAGRTDGGPPLPFDGVTYRDGKPYRLVWSSSIDGKLAEDNVVDVRGLSAGEHVITAEVTGRSGEVVRVSTHITVLPEPFPEIWIDPTSISLRAQYEKKNWPTVLRFTVLGRRPEPSLPHAEWVDDSPTIYATVTYAGHKTSYGVQREMGFSDGDGRLEAEVPWPFREAGNYDVSIEASGLPGEPELRRKDNVVLKSITWDGPADRDIPVRDSPEVTMAPGSLVATPAEGRPRGTVALEWTYELRNTSDQKYGFDVFVGTSKVSSDWGSSTQCHVVRYTRKANLRLPKEPGRYTITVHARIEGECEEALSDNDLKVEVSATEEPE